MVLRLLSYKLLSYGLSDPGLVRQNNEDDWAVVPEHHLFVLADGMGGHQAGEVASKEAVHFLCAHLTELFEHKTDKSISSLDMTSVMRNAIESTNQFVYHVSLSHDLLKGMGTTLCSLYFHDDYVVSAHVGDSRIYRLRHQQLEQLTQDHSLLRELLDRGQKHVVLSDSELYKNVITKAIGTEVLVDPCVNVSLIVPGDMYLLCSDGLSDMLTRTEIESYLNTQHTVEEKVRLLIHAAKQKGGYDNITVVLVEVTENADLPR